MQSLYNESPALRSDNQFENDTQSTHSGVSVTNLPFDSFQEEYGPHELHGVVHYLNRVPEDYLVYKQNYMCFVDASNNDTVYIEIKHDYDEQKIKTLLRSLGPKWIQKFPSDFEKFRSVASSGVNRAAESMRSSGSRLIQQLFEKLREFKNISIDPHLWKQLTRLIDIIYMTYTFFQNKCLTDFTMWAIYWVNNLIDKQYLPSAFVSSFNKKLQKSINIVCSEKTKFKSEAKTFGFTDDILEINKNLDTVLDSKLYNSLFDAVSSLVSWNLLPPKLAKMYFKSGCKAERCSLVGLFSSLLDATCKAIEFVRDVFKNGDWKLALRNDDPVSKFLYDCDEVLSNAKYHYDGDEKDMKVKGEFNLNTRKIMARCKELIKLSEQFKAAKGDVRSMAAVYAKAIAIKETLYRLEIYIINEGRMAPYAFMLHGLPGVGKSVLSSHIIHLLLKELGYPPEDRFVHSKNLNEQFWSGYNSSQHVALKLSEVGTAANNVVKNSGDENVKELLTIIDNILIFANMADIDSKGTTPIRPEIVAIDCNDPEMNLKFTVNNPAAVRRRILYILVVLKRQFRQSGGEELCKVKVAEHIAKGNSPLDLYEFDVYRMVPRNETDSQRQNWLCSADIFKLTDFLVADFAEYRRGQEKAKELRSRDPHEYKGKRDFKYPSPTLADFSHKQSSIIQSEALFGTHEEFFPDWESTTFMLSFLAISGFLLFTALSPFYLVAQALPFTGSFKKYCVHKVEYYRTRILLRSISCCESLYLRSLVKRLPDGCKIASVATTCGVALLAFWAFKSVLNSYKSEDFKQTVEGIPIMEIEGRVFAAPPETKKKINGSNEWTSDNLGPHLERNAKRLNNREELIAHSNRNRRFFKVVDQREGKSQIHQTGWILGVCENYFLINYHYLIGKEKPNFTVSIRKDMSTGVTFFTLGESDMVRIGGDLALCYNPALHFLDITHMFAQDHPSLSISGSIDSTDTVISTMYVHESDIIKDLNSVLYQYKFPGHHSGACGFPLFGYYNSQTFIAGLHCGYHKGKDVSLAAPILRKSIEGAIKKIKHDVPLMSVFSDGPFRLPEGVTFTSTHSYNSETNWVSCDKLVVHGQLTPYHSLSPKSQLIKNPLAPGAHHELGLPVYDAEGNFNFDIPMMKRGKVDGVYCSPVRNWLDKVRKPSYHLDNKRCAMIAEELVQGLYKDISKDVSTLSPVTQRVAINGYDLNFYIRSMNLSTSAGVLFPGGKRKYFTGEVGNLVPTPFLQNEVSQIISTYLEGYTSNAILGAQLKDEPRPRLKCLTGKTRVFAMSPVSMTIVQRMFLLPVYSKLMEPNNPFFSKIGINMHSSQVDKMYHELKNFSPLCIEGDYGGYDTSMPFNVGLMASTIVYRLCEKLGYCEDALKIVNGILSDNLHPSVDLNGDIITIPGFQPSGKYATAEDNSLRGLVLLYYAFRTMVPSDFGYAYFKDTVKPAIYGDDVIVAVKGVASRYFNNITYGNFVEKVYGMEFTPADKGSKHTKPFIHIDQVSFLKRNFRYSKILSRYVAPLSLESLAKTFTWVLPSKEVSIQEQCVQMCCSFLREIFFHVDTKEQYDKYRSKCIWLLSCDFIGEDFPLPLFDDCYKSSTEDKLILTIPKVEEAGESIVSECRIEFDREQIEESEELVWSDDNSLSEESQDNLFSDPYSEDPEIIANVHIIRFENTRYLYRDDELICVVQHDTTFHVGSPRIKEWYDMVFGNAVLTIDNIEVMVSRAYGDPVGFRQEYHVSYPTQQDN